MSIPYHKELFNNGRVRLFANFSNIKGDVADEGITLHFYATDENGIPIFTEQLPIESIRSLYNHLNAISVISDGTSKSEKFIETTDDINLILDKLKQSDLDAVLVLLKNFDSEQLVSGLLESLSELEIENLHGAYHHKVVTTELSNLESLMKLELDGNIVKDITSHPELAKYAAGQPEKIFQNWIEANLWIFGVEYVKKHDARKIALSSEGDVLMESVDGFLDLIELKRPKHELFKFDKSHKCYYPHGDLSSVIGQSLFYLQKLQEYKLVIEKEYSVKVIQPRVKIIIGSKTKLSAEELDTLRMLNTNLNSIQIITYQDLLHYGELILNSLKQTNDI